MNRTCRVESRARSRSPVSLRGWPHEGDTPLPSLEAPCTPPHAGRQYATTWHPWSPFTPRRRRSPRLDELPAAAIAVGGSSLEAPCTPPHAGRQYASTWHPWSPASINASLDLAVQPRVRQDVAIPASTVEMAKTLPTLDGITAAAIGVGRSWAELESLICGAEQNQAENVASSNEMREDGFRDEHAEISAATAAEAAAAVVEGSTTSSDLRGSCKEKHDDVLKVAAEKGSGARSHFLNHLATDADMWEPPVWIEDAETLRSDPVELGRRYARSQLAAHFGRPSPCDFLPAAVQRATDAHMQDVLEANAAASKHVVAGMASEILSVLQAIPDSDWVCRSRDNVKPEGASTTQQMTLGLVSSANQFAGIPLPTHGIFRYPGLCALLLRYVRLASPEARELPINAIQLTKNLQAKEHVDKNNRGKSIAVSFGNFSGGDLWVEADHGRSTRKLSHAVCVRGRRLVQGERVCGHRHRTLRAPTLFDGNDLHCTLPFRGERYAAVFFCIGRGNDRLPALSRAYMEHLGFSMPPEAAGAPQLTEVERTLLQMFDARVVIKDEPGRAPPPRPREGQNPAPNAMEAVVPVKKELDMD